MTSLNKNKLYYENKTWTLKRANKEMEEGMDIINSTSSKLISFFGSARISNKNRWYIHCYNLSKDICNKGYGVVTGGGPGIMHAANRGATESGAPSFGLKSELLTKEKIKEKIYTKTAEFHFFFVRRFLLAIKSEALIFYPGGFGTANELFEYLMLMQTDIVDKVPIICIGKEYWDPLIKWIKSYQLNEDFIDKRDLDLIKVVDTIQEVENIIL